MLTYSMFSIDYDYPSVSSGQAQHAPRSLVCAGHSSTFGERDTSETGIRRRESTNAYRRRGTRPVETAHVADGGGIRFGFPNRALHRETSDRPLQMGYGLPDRCGGHCVE